MTQGILCKTVLGYLPPELTTSIVASSSAISSERLRSCIFS